MTDAREALEKALSALRAVHEGGFKPDGQYVASAIEVARAALSHPVPEGRREWAREAARGFIEEWVHPVVDHNEAISQLTNLLTAFASQEVAAERERVWNRIIAHFVSRGTVPATKVVHQLRALKDGGPNDK